MITNILAAVVITLVTNVASSDNSKGCPMYVEGVMPAVMGHVCTPYIPPTERYQTTNVTEHTAVTLTIRGVERTFAEDKLLSSVTAIWRKSDEWQAAGVKTNSVEPTTGSIVWTNAIGNPIMVITNTILSP